MPSLSVGTNWTFQGRIINRDTLISIPATYKVTVVAADTQSTQYTSWNDDTQANVTGQVQQSLTISVVRSGTNVTPDTRVFRGIWANNSIDSYQTYQGSAVLTDDSGATVQFNIVTNNVLCSGKQSGSFQVNYTDSFSPIVAFTCHN